MTIAPTLKEPKGWRAAARRLLARLRIGRRATEAAEFDAAERRAYEAAVKLWGSLAPATASTPRPADPPGPVPDPAAATDAPTWAALPSPQNPPDDRPTGPAGTPSEPTVAAPYRRQPGDTTAPGSLLRTPSNVTLVADEFFDSLIRRAEGDR